MKFRGFARKHLLIEPRGLVEVSRLMQTPGVLQDLVAHRLGPLISAMLGTAKCAGRSPFHCRSDIVVKAASRCRV